MWRPTQLCLKGRGKKVRQKSEEHFCQQTNQYYFTAKLPANQAILFHWRILKTAQSAIWRYFHVETTWGLPSISRCQPTWIPREFAHQKNVIATTLHQCDSATPYWRSYSNVALTCFCNVADATYGYWPRSGLYATSEIRLLNQLGATPHAYQNYQKFHRTYLTINRQWSDVL